MDKPSKDTRIILFLNGIYKSCTVKSAKVLIEKGWTLIGATANSEDANYLILGMEIELLINSLPDTLKTKDKEKLKIDIALLATKFSGK